MDKVEYRELIRSIKNKYLQNDYEGVIAVSEQLEIEKIKENSILEIIAKAYENLSRCDLAKEILLIAYKRMPAGKRIAYNLAMLCIELDDLDEAVAYYEDFCKIAPKDNQRLLLKYQIGRAGGVAVGNLAHVLEKYVSREMDEKWQYELATLYHELGDDDKCASACDQIILWYANGEYEKNALELKKKHKELTPAQQARYEDLMQYAAEEEADDEIITEETADEEIINVEAVSEETINEKASEIEEAVSEEAIDEEVSEIEEAAVEPEAAEEEIIPEETKKAEEKLPVKEEIEEKLPEIDYHTKHLGSADDTSNGNDSDDENISGQLSLMSMFEAFKSQTIEEREQMNKLGKDRAAKILAEVNGSHDSSALEAFNDDIYEEEIPEAAEEAEKESEEDAFEEVIEPEVPLLNREDEIVPADDGGEDLWERKPEFAFEMEAAKEKEKISSAPEAVYEDADYEEISDEDEADSAEIPAGEIVDDIPETEEIPEAAEEAADNTPEAEAVSEEVAEEKHDAAHCIEQSLDATQFIPVDEIVKLAGLQTNEDDFYTDIKSVGDDIEENQEERTSADDFEPGRELTEAEKAIIAYEASKMLNQDEKAADFNMSELFDMSEALDGSKNKDTKAAESDDDIELPDLDLQENEEVPEEAFTETEELLADEEAEEDESEFLSEAEAMEDSILSMGKERKSSSKVRKEKKSIFDFFVKRKNRFIPEKDEEFDDYSDEYSEEDQEIETAQADEITEEEGAVPEAAKADDIPEAEMPEEEINTAEAAINAEIDIEGMDEILGGIIQPENEAVNEKDLPPVLDDEAEEEFYDDEYEDVVEEDKKTAKKSLFAWFKRKKNHFVAEEEMEEEPEEAEVQEEAAEAETEVQEEAEEAAEAETEVQEEAEEIPEAEAEVQEEAEEAAEAESEVQEEAEEAAEAESEVQEEAEEAAEAETEVQEEAEEAAEAEAEVQEEAEEIPEAEAEVQEEAEEAAEAEAEIQEEPEEAPHLPTAREIKRAEKLEKKKEKALKKQQEKELEKKIKKDLAEQKALKKQAEKEAAKLESKKENIVGKQRPERRRMEVEANAKKLEKEKARLAASKPVIDQDIIDAVDAATAEKAVTPVIPAAVPSAAKSFSINDFVNPDKPVAKVDAKSAEIDLDAFIKPDKSVVPEFINKKKPVPEFDLDSFIDAGEDKGKKKAPLKEKAKETEHFDVNDFINPTGGKKKSKAKDGQKRSAFEELFAERKKNQQGLQKMTRAAEKEKPAKPAEVPVVPTKKVVFNKKYELSKEQRKNLAEFLLIDGMEEAICSTIEKLIIKKKSGDETGGHLIITGDKKTGKTYLVIEIIKAVNKEIGHGNPRVAKVQSQAINGKDVKKVLSKVTDSDLIIENIGKLEDDTVRDLITAVRESNAPTMVILEGNELAADTMIQNFPDIGKIFKTRIDIGELTLTQWADLAKKYAAGQGYSISDMAELSLHAKIDEINTPDVRLGFKQVRSVVDAAIEKAEKRNSAKIFSAFSKKGEALIPLEENDFM